MEEKRSGGKFATNLNIQGKKCSDPSGQKEKFNH